MVDHRAGRRMPPHGRADAAVVAAMRQAIGEATDEPTRTAVFVFRRTQQILAGPGGDSAAKMPSERTLYRLFARLQAGRHTTGSAKARRSLAARPEGPFGQVAVSAPGDLMQISWRQRMRALITSNPRAVIESCLQELFTAGGYPETVTTTAKTIQSRRPEREAHADHRDVRSRQELAAARARRPRLPDCPYRLRAILIGTSTLWCPS